jgi:hypothetical protein
MSSQDRRGLARVFVVATVQQRGGGYNTPRYPDGPF